MARTINELQQLQALPLSAKVKRTQRKIREWVEEFGTDGVYVSFSGGKDSTVLLHLVRELFPDVPAVFSVVLILVFVIGFILGAVAVGLVLAVGMMTKCDEKGDWFDE